MIEFKCQKCGKQFRLQDDAAGREGMCSCGSIVNVPFVVADSPGTAPRGRIIQLGQQSELDLGGLSDETASAIQERHAQETVQIDGEARRVALATKALEKKLELLNDAATTATTNGYSMKIDDKTDGPSGTTTTQIVTRSSRELSIIYMLVAVVIVVVVILALVAMHH